MITPRKRNKRRSGGAPHAAISLRWSVNLSLSCLYQDNQTLIVLLYLCLDPSLLTVQQNTEVSNNNIIIITFTQKFYLYYISQKYHGGVLSNYWYLLIRTINSSIDNSSALISLFLVNTIFSFSISFRTSSCVNWGN